MAAAERRGIRLIAVVIRSRDAASDAAALLGSRLPKTRGTTTFVAAGERLGTLFFPAGGLNWGDRSKDDVGGLADPSTLAMELRIRPGLTAPLDAGVVVGRLVISSNGERIATVPGHGYGGSSWDDDVGPHLRDSSAPSPD